MPKYISLDYYCENVCKCNADSCDKEKCPLWAAPACDVVEVLRCKDCVYSYFVSQYSKYECSRLGILLFSDDFCSFGERKEDEK